MNPIAIMFVIIMIVMAVMSIMLFVYVSMYLVVLGSVFAFIAI